MCVKNGQMAIKNNRETEIWTLFEHQRHQKKSKKDTFIQTETERRVSILMRRATLSVKTISNQPSTMSTNDHLEPATPAAAAANLFQGCRTNLQDRLAENNSAVTGTEIKLPISQQKRESGAPCDSPLNRPIHLRGQTWTNTVKNHHYGPLGHFKRATMTMKDT